MIALRLTLPFACWRKAHARELLETEPIPPPSTCYGFLLSLVGEEDRNAHIGARVTSGTFKKHATSQVLRTLWRIKSKKLPMGTGKNAAPDFQQLATQADLVIFLDSKDEGASLTLENRVKNAIENPASVERFGGLSLGESTHLVNDVLLLEKDALKCEAFLAASKGRMALTTWVDHVGFAGTRRAVGNLTAIDGWPKGEDLPLISPAAS